jgi:hypothetical protein
MKIILDNEKVQNNTDLKGANTLGITTFSIMTFGITTFSIMTFSITTLSKMGLFVTLSINDYQHNNNTLPLL